MKFAENDVCLGRATGLPIRKWKISVS